MEKQNSIMQYQGSVVKHQNGFTLIELMIVIAIIGILVAVVAGVSGGGNDSVGLYGYFKSKDVSGHLESVTSAMPAGSIVGNNVGTNVFQASVMVMQDDRSYITFSTEDRQWASLEGNNAKGKCVTARIYPYAPWNFSKAGTYHGGRLLSVKDCR